MAVDAPVGAGAAVTAPATGSSSVAGAHVHELGAAAARAASAATSTARVRYVVKAGDSLSSIARYFDLKGYEALYRANRTKLLLGPGIIYVGEVITVADGRMAVSPGGR